MKLINIIRELLKPTPNASRLNLWLRYQITSNRYGLQILAEDAEIVD